MGMFGRHERHRVRIEFTCTCCSKTFERIRARDGMLPWKCEDCIRRTLNERRKARRAERRKGSRPVALGVAGRPCGPVLGPG